MNINKCCINIKNKVIINKYDVARERSQLKAKTGFHLPPWPFWLPPRVGLCSLPKMNGPVCTFRTILTNLC